MENVSQGYLDDLSLNELTRAFNQVYEGYLIPARVDDAWMVAHLEQNDVALGLSPLMREPDTGTVVGLALLGVRGDRGWVGGFGIAPDYRGRRLSHTLMERVLTLARSAGVRSLVLEVLQPNIAAIRTYERAGFTRTRGLHIYERPAGRVQPQVGEGLSPCDPEELLAIRHQFDAPRPSWQREATSLRGVTGLDGFMLDDGSAWAIVKASGDRLRIHDIAAKDVDAAMRLLQSLDTVAPGASMVIVNEPDDSPVIPALVATGWNEAIHQWEMTRQLD